MDTVSLKCFGVGDGFPNADRGHSSFLYRLGGARFLMDCGEPLSSGYLGTSLSYDSLDGIFLSHLHADHVGGFLLFIQGLWLKKRRRDLTVFLPPDGIAPLRQMLHAAYLFDELFGFRLEFAPLEAGRTVAVAGARVTPFLTTHLDNLRVNYQKKYPQNFEAFSFLLEAGGVRIGHSADLGAPEDLAPLLEQPLDLLVCELAHFKPDALFDWLAGRPVKKLVLVHLAQRHWDNQAALLQAAASKLPGTRCSIARSGEEITL